MINSPYVVKVKKAIELPEKFYIFLEYCNGGDLKELLECKDWELPSCVVQEIFH